MRNTSSSSSSLSKTKSNKTVSELYYELFSKTHGDRIEWFVAFNEWMIENKKRKNHEQQQNATLISSTASTFTDKIERILYLGSYIHIGASVVWCDGSRQHVTYVDKDKKAVDFFERQDNNEIIKLIQEKRKLNCFDNGNDGDGDGGDIVPSFNFVNADYNDKDKLNSQLLMVHHQKHLNDVDLMTKENELCLYDLLISSYAGFVSRAGKDFIRRGGYLLANNSHGDASLAYMDQEKWKLVGVITRGSKPIVSTKDLDQYMIPKKRKKKEKKNPSTTLTTTERKRRRGDDDDDDSDGDGDHDHHPTAEEIIHLGCGIGYTKDCAAYIFRRL